MRLRYRIKIYGRVQGVGFRWNAAREARDLGLGGFVRNEPDGSVYAEAEGERELLEMYLAWCRSGPVFAHVEDVIVEECHPEGISEFRILH